MNELVANAWDAGATKVEILIPDDYNFKLIVEDNRTGLTKKEFENCWMRLGSKSKKSVELLMPGSIRNIPRNKKMKFLMTN